MKAHLIGALLLSQTITSGFAQENAQFASFARTKDSLMHIAFYDGDVSGYKKQFNEAIAGYNKLNANDKKEFRDYIDDEYYYMARAYAIIGDKVNALSNLEQCKNIGYDDLQSEADFDNLRKEPRFIKLVTTAKNQKSKYLLTLQADNKYNLAEKNNVPAFVYQPASNENLAALKKTFNLDSIAGDGNDVSRMINLMKWVHYCVTHNGSKGNPATKNAMNLLKECTQDKKTLNCRGLAIVLNEVYLAEGFKSKYVTCLPKDTADNDCHVITMVWSTSLKKWVWMDPTFMAYVMNEHGELLSIEEVRERLVNNKPLILNPDANYNHGVSQTKGYLLENYMAKNLYKLECPVSSEYDYETSSDGKVRAYVQLMPGTSAPQPSSKKDQQGVERFKVYYTNNPKKFWAAPCNTTIAANKGNSGHTQAQYEAAINQFKNCYNQKSGKCFIEMFAGDQTVQWADAALGGDFKTFGAIKSFKYLGMEMDNEWEDVALFKIECEQSVHCMGISLDEKNKIGTWRFKTYSNYIDWLLAKDLDKSRKAGK